jgi:hypothetical protein
MVRPITTFDWIPYQIFANGRRQRPADGPGPSPRPARLLSSRDSCWPWIAARPVAAETAPPPARRLLLARQLIFSGRRTTPYAMRGNAGVPSAAAFGKRFGGGFRAVTHRSRERQSNPMTRGGCRFGRSRRQIYRSGIHAQIIFSPRNFSNRTPAKRAGAELQRALPAIPDSKAQRSGPIEAPVFRDNEERQHDRLIANHSIEMAFAAHVLEKNHRPRIEPPDLAVRHFDGYCTFHHDHKLPRRRLSDESLQQASNLLTACREVPVPSAPLPQAVKVFEMRFSLLISPDTRDCHGRNTSLAHGF